MRAHPFLAGLDTAPGAHRSMVTNPEAGGAIRYGEQHPDAGFVADAHADLTRKQRLATALGPVMVNANESLPMGQDAGWNDLRDSTNAWLEAHLAGVDFSNYDPDDFPNSEHARQNVFGAARQGIATISAFLEVVPVTLAWRLDGPLQEPDKAIVEWAERSKGFIVEWLGLSETMDYRLADALAKQPGLGPFAVFKDLHFEWIPFIADPKSKEVRLDPEMMPALTSSGVKIVDADPAGRPLFGCPARKMIPQLYDFMVRHAADAGLFGDTYRQERAAHDAFWESFDKSR